MTKPTKARKAQNQAKSRPPDAWSGLAPPAGELKPSMANQRHTAANASEKIAAILLGICKLNIGGAQEFTLRAKDPSRRAALSSAPRSRTYSSLRRTF